jgi:hypothetical protein
MFPFGKLNSKSRPNVAAMKGCALAVGIGLISTFGAQEAQAFDFSKLLSSDGISAASYKTSTSKSGRVSFRAGDFSGTYKPTTNGIPEVSVRAGRAKGYFSASKNYISVGGHKIPTLSLAELTNQPEATQKWSDAAIKKYKLNARHTQDFKQLVRFAPTISNTLAIQGAISQPASNNFAVSSVDR